MKQQGFGLLFVLMASVLMSLLILNYAQTLMTTLRIQHNQEEHEKAVYQAQQLAQTLKKRIDGWITPPEIHAHCLMTHCVLPLSEDYLEQPLSWWQQHAQATKNAHYFIQQLQAFPPQIFYRILIFYDDTQAQTMITLTVAKVYAQDKALASHVVGWWMKPDASAS